MPDAHDLSKRHAPSMLTRTSPCAWTLLTKNFTALLRASGSVRRCVCSSVFKRRTVTWARSCVISARSFRGDVALARPDSRGESSVDRGAGNCGLKAKMLRLGCPFPNWCRRRGHRRRPFRGSDKRGGANGARIRLAAAKGLGRQPAGSVWRRCLQTLEGIGGADRCGRAARALVAALGPLCGGPAFRRTRGVATRASSFAKGSALMVDELEDPGVTNDYMACFLRRRPRGKMVRQPRPHGTFARRSLLAPSRTGGGREATLRAMHYKARRNGLGATLGITVGPTATTRAPTKAFSFYIKGQRRGAQPGFQVFRCTARSASPLDGRLRSRTGPDNAAGKCYDHFRKDHHD